MEARWLINGKFFILKDNQIMLNTILLDLDGTLLPLDLNIFIKKYLEALAAKTAPLGYAPEPLIEAVWKGTYAMVTNDGTMTNNDRFWSVFWQKLGKKDSALFAAFDDFYRNEFYALNDIFQIKEDRSELVHKLKAKGYTIVLATSPIFPPAALASRLSWIGLETKDFDHLTHYENCSYCKPNLNYYRQIMQAIDKEPTECLMVGNNITEDCVATKLGCDTYFVTDWPENKEGQSYEHLKHGSWQEFCSWANELKNIK